MPDEGARTEPAGSRMGSVPCPATIPGSVVCGTRGAERTLRGPGALHVGGAGILVMKDMLQPGGALDFKPIQGPSAVFRFREPGPSIHEGITEPWALSRRASSKCWQRHRTVECIHYGWRIEYARTPSR